MTRLAQCVAAFSAMVDILFLSAVLYSLSQAGPGQPVLWLLLVLLLTAGSFAAGAWHSRQASRAAHGAALFTGAAVLAALGLPDPLTLSELWFPITLLLIGLVLLLTIAYVTWLVLIMVRASQHRTV